MSDYILHFSMKEPETLDAAVTALDKINSNSKLLQGLVLYYVKVRRLFRSVAPTFDDWCERISSQYNWDLSMRRAEFYARCGGIVHRLHRRGYTHEEIFKKVPSAHALYQLLPNTFLTKNHWIDGQHLAIISRELTVLLKVMESEVNIKEYLHAQQQQQQVVADPATDDPAGMLGAAQQQQTTSPQRTTLPQATAATTGRGSRSSRSRATPQRKPANKARTALRQQAAPAAAQATVGQYATSSTFAAGNAQAGNKILRKVVAGPTAASTMAAAADAEIRNPVPVYGTDTAAATAVAAQGSAHHAEINRHPSVAGASAGGTTAAATSAGGTAAAAAGDRTVMCDNKAGSSTAAGERLHKCNRAAACGEDPRPQLVTADNATQTEQAEGTTAVDAQVQTNPEPSLAPMMTHMDHLLKLVNCNIKPGCDGSSVLQAIIAAVLAARVQHSPNADPLQIGNQMMQHIGALAAISGYQPGKWSDLMVVADKMIGQLTAAVGGGHTGQPQQQQQRQLKSEGLLAKTPTEDSDVRTASAAAGATTTATVGGNAIAAARGGREAAAAGAAVDVKIQDVADHLGVGDANSAGGLTNEVAAATAAQCPATAASGMCGAAAGTMDAAVADGLILGAAGAPIMLEVGVAKAEAATPAADLDPLMMVDLTSDSDDDDEILISTEPGDAPDAKQTLPNKNMAASREEETPSSNLKTPALYGVKRALRSAASSSPCKRVCKGTK